MSEQSVTGGEGIGARYNGTLRLYTAVEVSEGNLREANTMNINEVTRHCTANVPSDIDRLKFSVAEVLHADDSCVEYTL